MKHAFWFCLAVGLCLSSSVAQQSPATSASAASNATVPTLVNFSGTLTDASGKPLTGVVGVTFSLYKDDQISSPLWIETQNVQPDRLGRYTVALGSTRGTGLPADIFVAGEARWLGVQPHGQKELPRIMLLSVPYALKAGDAQTIGGLPPSAFVLAAPSAAPSSNSGTSPTAPPPPATITGSGTAGFLPDFTGAATIGNSAIFQSGSSPTAKIGINTTTPTATLDVTGGAVVRGFFTLPATGVATATTGKFSQPLDFVASAFSSSSSSAVAQTFQWKAEPANNNTSTPSATLHLLYGSGTAAPAETGLRIGPKGILGFAPGQTFPGTIDGITTAAGSGLKGGGTSSTLTLGLITTCSSGQVLKWNGTAWVCSSSGAGTITGVLAGIGLTGGGTAGTVTLNVDATKVPLLAAANTFTNNQAIHGTGSGFSLLVSPPDAAANSGLAGSNALEAAGSSADPNGLKAGGVGITAFGGTGGTLNVSGNGGNAINAFGGSAGNGNGGVGVQAGGGFGTGGGVSTGAGGPGVLAQGGDSDLFSGGDGVNATGGAGGQGNNFASTSGNGVVGTGGAGGFQEADGDGGFFTGGTAGGFGGFGIEVFAGSDLAAFFSGDVTVTGAISAGTKDFKIDHPLDPANKYLYHASVESSEMMNVYSGNVTTDAQGDAEVRLPNWFEAVNTDFRYQLTVLGQFAQAIVSRRVSNNQFAIKTDKPNVDVSWQITGIRQDAFAKAHPLVVEEQKNARERGFYLHPELYGAPEEKAVAWSHHPEAMRRAKATQRRKAAPTLRRTPHIPASNPTVAAAAK
ncbi:MAG TPA: hypothetical protein VFE61_01865 [Candidatus Sulfotelmatobacter sp.]|nr:hypothetical protein [Candidatus Sulfotelmatobacter sp.]